MACITRCAFSGSGSLINFPNSVGITCQDRPYLSFNQPHFDFSPPLESFSQSSFTSSCVSQSTKSEMASVNLNFGPPFRAINFCPSNSKVTTIGEALTILEFLKTEQ